MQDLNLNIQNRSHDPKWLKMAAVLWLIRVIPLKVVSDQGKCLGFLMLQNLNFALSVKSLDHIKAEMEHVIFPKLPHFRLSKN